MLYKIAHLLRDNCPWLWDLAEAANSLAFACRYHRGLKRIDAVLATVPSGVHVRRGVEADADALAAFFARQPEDAFTYFRPHAFDRQTLQTLLRRTSFIVVVAEIDGQIVGYSFLRSFVHGRCYMGKMVDAGMQRRGIGKALCLATMYVADALGLRMFESINRANIASLKSSSVLRQVIIEELEDGDMLIEDFLKTTD